jgi:hypothetical protein
LGIIAVCFCALGGYCSRFLRLAFYQPVFLFFTARDVVTSLNKFFLNRRKDKGLKSFVGVPLGYFEFLFHFFKMLNLVATAGVFATPGLYPKTETFKT